MPSGTVHIVPSRYPSPLPRSHPAVLAHFVCVRACFLLAPCPNVTHRNHPFPAPCAPCISVRASPTMTLTLTMSINVHIFIVNFPLPPSRRPQKTGHLWLNVAHSDHLAVSVCRTSSLILHPSSFPMWGFRVTPVTSVSEQNLLFDSHPLRSYNTRSQRGHCAALSCPQPGRKFAFARGTPLEHLSPKREPETTLSEP